MLSYTMKRNTLNNFTVKNLKLNKNVIIYSGNSHITLTGKAGDSVAVPPLSLYFLEKKLCFDLNVTSQKKGVTYDFYAIPEKTSCKIKKSYEFLADVSPNDLIKHRGFKERIFPLNTDEFSVKIFKDLTTHKSHDEEALFFELLFILSRTQQKNDLFKSFFITSVKSFSDQVKNIINDNIGKKWRIGDISEILNISEITVRKKLEVEATTFNNLLLDMRMHTAMQYIIYEDLHINQIASVLGFSTPSYFIKIFKEYYGITPKKLMVCYRKANFGSD
ncbi:helix-turn-helix transcriptional regulator [Escherichia coli]|uniref:AraC family transcriptional regulator n=1 Tax=Escherichia coli TaxID=562 RepID=UPI0038B32AE2